MGWRSVERETMSGASSLSRWCRREPHRGEYVDTHTVDAREKECGKKEKRFFECLSAHSFDVRFSHAGLASLFITKFSREKKELHQQYIHIFYTFFSAVESRSLSLCFLFRVYTIKKSSEVFHTLAKGRELSRFFHVSHRKRSSAEIFVVSWCQSSTGIQFL